MENLNNSFLNVKDYPQNLTACGAQEYLLKEYHERLNREESRLFCDASDVVVDLLQLEEAAIEFRHDRVRSEDELQRHFRVFDRQGMRDPICRFIFFHAPNARDKLSTTRYMFAFALTYHQVIPGFLDYLFPFGKQDYAKDFHFCGFRTESWLNMGDRDHQVKELGRSGRHFQMCFNLRAVESTNATREWPWSIRQTAVHHSFDVETGRTSWIMIKGNKLMRNRIKQATNSRSLCQATSFNKASAAFSASLTVHMMLCDWAGEGWRWYINFLEDQCNEITRPALLARVDSPPVQETDFNAPPLRCGTLPTPGMQRRLTNLTDGLMGFRRAITLGTHNTTGPTVDSFQLSDIPSPALGKLTEDPQFSFSDLQRIQNIEEKTHETHLVLVMNSKVLEKLQRYYRTLPQRPEWPADIGAESMESIAHFDTYVSNAITDLEMQQSRLLTLLNLLSDRRKLLFTILDYKNMLTNRHLSQKAQVSASKMESMTQHMKEVAIKTEQETVSMRIVTVVTLIFLPGTYVSTLFSTDIIKWPTNASGKPTRIFAPGALLLYLYITIPMMLITFIVAWLFRRWEANRAKRRDAVANLD